MQLRAGALLLVVFAACAHAQSKPSVSMTTEGVVKPGESPSIGGSMLEQRRSRGASPSPFENGPTGTPPSGPDDFVDRDGGAATTMPAPEP